MDYLNELVGWIAEDVELGDMSNEQGERLAVGLIEQETGAKSDAAKGAYTAYVAWRRAQKEGTEGEDASVQQS